MNRKLKYYIQVNSGAEKQKGGVSPEECINLYKLCKKNLDINIVGLMCIPRLNEEPSLHFALISNLAKELGLKPSKDTFDAITSLIKGMDESEEVLMQVCPQDIDDCYTADIPSLSYDSEIKYYIQAIDYSGRVEKSPLAGYYSFSAVAGITFNDGDVNQDDQVNVLDVVLTVNFVLGAADLSSSQQQLADMNNDNGINIQDIILLVNTIIGQ